MRRLAPALLAPVLARRGLPDVRLVTEWRSIVGAELSRLARPLKISFPRGSRTGATLHVEVEGAAAPLIQHAAPQLVERVNALLGYGAVTRLKIHHRSVDWRAASARRGAFEDGIGFPGPRRERRPEPAPEPPASLDRIADPGLREALARLGRTLRRR